VLSESVNNPWLLAGWYITKTGLLPPTSLLISYWMIGCYYMIKRAEYRDIGDANRSKYRKSFAFMTSGVLVSTMFMVRKRCCSLGPSLRYRLELILSFSTGSPGHGDLPFAGVQEG
jgi:hypothetical protein